MKWNKQKLTLIISLTLNFVFLFTGLFFTYRKGYTIQNLPCKLFGICSPEDFSLSNYYLLYASRYKFRVKLHKQNQAIVFLGDSISYQGPWHEYFPNYHVVNRGINGDDTSGVIKRLNSVTAILPKKIFLMIGTNDLWRKKSVDEIISNTVTILDEIHIKTPSTKIYLESVLPVRDNIEQDNDDIIKINAKLKKIADERGYPFIDLHTPLKDADGMLAKEYTHDGLHLNGKGYDVWVKTVKALVLDN